MELVGTPENSRKRLSISATFVGFAKVRILSESVICAALRWLFTVPPGSLGCAPTQLKPTSATMPIIATAISAT